MNENTIQMSDATLKRRYNGIPDPVTEDEAIIFLHDRVLASLGFDLDRRQLKYILGISEEKLPDISQSAKRSDKKYIKRAETIKQCLWRYTVNNKEIPYEAQEELNKVNIHRFDDAERYGNMSLWEYDVARYKYYIRYIYTALEGNGLKLKKIIF